MTDFSRTYRLNSKKDFQFVFDKPHKVTHRNLAAVYRPNQLAHARLGIIIAKQYVKQAVQRNRIRRIIRESFRHHKELVKGLDIIVLMRSQCIPISNTSSQSNGLLPSKKTLRNDVDNLWQILSKRA